MNTEARSTIDLRKTPRAECETRLEAGLAGLNTGQSAVVIANHNPARIVENYETDRKTSLDWEFEKEGPGEWLLNVTKGEHDGFEIFDVTGIPPHQRHKDILSRFTAMAVGEGFILVNDHDPKPLFYELRSIHGHTFEWEYQKQEPGECRVQIEKTGESQDLPEQASTRVDVRQIPPQDRHASIFHRFDLLAPGDAMEIVADHDPQPLRHQLEEIHGGTFSLDYVEKEPGLCRVLLTKNEPSEATDDESEEVSNESEPSDFPELDVREYPPAKRHDLVFERYEHLRDGEGFVLVNDHDPKPLSYQLKEEFSGELRWEYLQQNDGEWKVLIGKA